MSKHNTNMAREEPKIDKAKRMILNIGRRIRGQPLKGAGMSEEELKELLAEATIYSTIMNDDGGISLGDEE